MRCLDMEISTCVPYREYCQQKTQNGGNSIDVLFWSSASRSDDDPFFRFLSRFQTVNKLKLDKAKKRGALYGKQKTSFSKSSTDDALTVLSVWDTDQHHVIFIIIINTNIAL